jgi:hypothetical protein
MSTSSTTTDHGAVAHSGETRITVDQLPTQLPPVECTPWCREGDGHVDEWHPDDQQCDSAGHVIALSKVPLVPMSDGARCRDWLEVHLARDSAGRTEIRVQNEVTIGFLLKMTPGEARLLAAALNAEADCAESVA